MPALNVSKPSGPVAASHLLSRHGLAVQFVLYLFVGGVSFLADLAVFLTLLPLGYAVALVPGFVVGTLTNYVLSRLIAFQGGRHTVASEIAMLVTVAATGAALTLILVMGMVELGMGVVAAKIVATPMVLLWNFLGRRYLVFRPDIPEGICRLIRADRGAPAKESRGNV
ncbi:MAG: GtrA family protein [Paracoccaceae bacterium]